MSNVKGSIMHDRERKMLEFIISYFQAHRIGPTHDEILLHLAQVLPKREDGVPVVYSKQQTRRMVTSLRKQGLLIQAENGAHRVIVPTEAAERLLREN